MPSAHLSLNVFNMLQERVPWCEDIIIFSYEQFIMKQSEHNLFQVIYLFNNVLSTFLFMIILASDIVSLNEKNFQWFTDGNQIQISPIRLKPDPVVGLVYILLDSMSNQVKSIWFKVHIQSKLL